MRTHVDAQVMAISQLVREEFGGERDLSGIGGVESGRDAAEFLLLGANSVQARARQIWLRQIRLPATRSDFQGHACPPRTNSRRRLRLLAEATAGCADALEKSGACSSSSSAAQLDDEAKMWRRRCARASCSTATRW
jgi:hypothetical protein